MEKKRSKATVSDWYIRNFLDPYHEERKSRLFQKSKGFKIIFNYIRDLVLTEQFQETMLKMRNQHGIPPSGFFLEGNGPWTHPPEEWGRDRVEIHKIRIKLRQLCADHFLLPRDWYDVFEFFLFYNKIQIALEPNAYNLCFVSDLKTKVDTRGQETTQEDINAFPITLHISPYASKRSILDYIDKFYKTEIAVLQAKHKSPLAEIGKHRTKKELIRKRNNFAYLNRNIPRKQLVSSLNQLFPNASVDEGSVGKIISLERKKRKEV